MIDLIATAAWVSRQLDDLGLSHFFIGGVCLQMWGEVRVTADVDVAVVTGFDREAEKVDLILSKIQARIDGAREFAMAHRVLLCRSAEGIGIDIGLAAFPYEERALARSRIVDIGGTPLRLASPEDLVIMKVFAGRPQDWADVHGIIVRQGVDLDWSIVETELEPLLDAIEKPERLEELRRQRLELY